MGTSEIHNLIALPETTSEIRFLLQEFVKEFESQNSIAWNKKVKATNKKYHCHELLKKGLGEISQSYNKKSDELSGEELVCLFNYYYFPILFESSFEIFSRIWDSKFEHRFISNNALVFIDIGCRTFPSSLAFSQIYNQKIQNQSIWGANSTEPFEFNINSYVFIDESPYISSYIDNYFSEHFSAREYRNHWTFNISPLDIFPTGIQPVTDVFHVADRMIFDNGLLIDSFHLLKIKEKYFARAFDLLESIDSGFPFHNLVDSFNHNKSVIININYLGSVHFFDVEEITFAIKRLISTNDKTNFAIIFQNNGNLDLQLKWEELKENLGVRSVSEGQIKLAISPLIKINYEILFRSNIEK